MAKQTATTEFVPVPRLSGECEDGCQGCPGWVDVPFCGHQAFPCPCTRCTHPDAWKEREFEDFRLAGMYRAYPGEKVPDGRRQRVLGWWPGATPRPVVYYVCTTRMIDGEPHALDVRVDVYNPVHGPGDAYTAEEIAIRAGYTLCPTMGGGTVPTAGPYPYPQGRPTLWL